MKHLRFNPDADLCAVLAATGSHVIVEAVSLPKDILSMVNVPLLFAVRTKDIFIADNAVKCHANNFMIILVMLNTEISRVVQG